jgi:hypothetical protein
MPTQIFEIRWQGRGERPELDEEIDFQVASNSISTGPVSELQSYPRSQKVWELAYDYGWHWTPDMMVQTRLLKEDVEFGRKTLGDIFKDDDFRWIKFYRKHQKIPRLSIDAEFKKKSKAYNKVKKSLVEESVDAVSDPHQILPLSTQSTPG